MGQERRSAPRAAERVALAVSDTDFACTAETRNISASGAYCTVDRFIPPMTKLQLVFELPEGSRRVKIRCTGVVVRVEPVVEEAQRGRYHIAVFFSDLSDRDRSAISRFVQQRLAAGSTKTD